MAADGLRGVLGLGDLVHKHHLEGMFKDAGHVVPVEFLLALGAVDRFQVLTSSLVAADIDFKAALHPQEGLNQPLNVVVVGLGHLWGAVDKGMAGGHLAVGPLHGDAHRLFGALQKGVIKTHQGDKLRVQRGDILQLHLDSKSVHKRFLLKAYPEKIVQPGYFTVELYHRFVQHAIPS